MANGKIILAVDDDPGSRRLLQFILAKTGCEIVTASDGEQALSIALNGPIDLLVTDVMMERVGGMQLTHALRRMQAYADLPIIMLSARWRDDHRQELSNDSHTVIMTKPFSPIDLTAQVKLLLKL